MNREYSAFPDDEMPEKKPRRFFKPLIIIALLLAFLTAGTLYAMRSMTAPRYVDSRNSEAQVCIKAMNNYFETVFTNNGVKIPADKSYLIIGHTDNSGMHIDPCELLENGGDSTNWSHSKLYWAVRVADGKACEAWTYKEPLDEDMLVYYSREEQVEQRRKHIFSDVIGYYNTGEGDRYYH